MKNKSIRIQENCIFDIKKEMPYRFLSTSVLYCCEETDMKQYHQNMPGNS